jgi:hypothetical protein
MLVVHVHGGKMNVFEEVKSALDMPTAARYYGLKINRSGMALCPFHHEKTPSAKIYPDSFHCFGCGEHGDVIGFTEKMFGLSPIEAAKKLCEDVNLGLDIGCPPSKREKCEYMKQASERRAYEDWEKSDWKTLNDYLWLMRDWKEKYAPIMPGIPADVYPAISEPTARTLRAMLPLSESQLAGR